MLFLLNDDVLDLGDPENCLIDTLGVIGVRHERLSPRDVIDTGQSVYFRLGRERTPVLNVRLATASLVILKLDAGAAMFHVPPGARSPSDVRTRFSTAPIALLANLRAIQSAGGLAPPRIADAIWRSAS